MPPQRLCLCLSLSLPPSFPPSHPLPPPPLSDTLIIRKYFYIFSRQRPLPTNWVCPARRFFLSPLYLFLTSSICLFWVFLSSSSNRCRCYRPSYTPISVALLFLPMHPPPPPPFLPFRFPPPRPREFCFPSLPSYPPTPAVVGLPKPPNHLLRRPAPCVSPNIWHALEV